MKRLLFSSGSVWFVFLLGFGARSAEMAPPAIPPLQISWGAERLTLDAALARFAADANLAKYREKQAAVANTPVGHVALADWCRDNGLREQEHAHLLRALEFEPDNEALRNRLGHIRGDVRWQSPEEVAAGERQRKALDAAREQWLPKLQEAKRRLLSGDTRSVAAGEAALLAVRDPLVVPVLEELFSKDAKQAANVLQTVTQIDHPLGVDAIVRLAVDGPSTAVRKAAIAELARLDRYSYVPVLLAGLKGPITATSTSAPTTQGTEYVQRLAREAQDREERLIVKIQVRPDSGNVDSHMNALITRRVRHEDYLLRKEVDHENGRVAAKNSRIMAALEGATGERLPRTPNALWDWWRRQNEVEEQRRRSVVTRNRNYDAVLSSERPLAAPEMVPETFQTSLEFNSEVIRQRCECFVAGTLVWSERGPVAIEKVCTGDRVLTRKPETGEMEFKAVIRPTTRPPQALVHLRIGKETFICTGGHLFWIEGQGWKKARDLAPGQFVRCSQGSLPVIQNEPGLVEQTHNLVVADNHNYFVGMQCVLSHDNSPRQPLTSK